MARLPSRSKGFVLIAVMLLSLGNAAGQQGAKNGEWRVWGADAGSARYSPVDQINRQNVKNLKVPGSGGPTILGQDRNTRTKRRR